MAELKKIETNEVSVTDVKVEKSETEDAVAATEFGQVSLDKNNSAIILSDELLHPASALETGTKIEAGTETETETDKVDELSSLEREIAEMDEHQVKPAAPVQAKRVSQSQLEHTNDGGETNYGHDHEGKHLLEMQPASRKSTPVAAEGDALANGTSTTATTTAHLEDILAHEDLIAVLKGIEEDDEVNASVQQGPTNVKEAEIEGVTIEGEGEFQVIDVFDADSDDVGSKDGETTAAAENRVSEKSKTATVGEKTFGGSIMHLTNEEVRAMAMEQIQTLKRREKPHRRKQDIKPLQLEAQDLVNSLGAEWSDDEASVKGGGALPSNNIANADVSTSSSNECKNSSLSREEPSSKVDEINAANTERTELDDSAKVTSVVVLQSNKTKSASPEENQKKSGERIVPQTNIGFRRTRIIKRKIIWDPDAPETQFSYAQLVRSSTKPKIESTTTKTTSSTPMAKEPAAKKLRSIPPKMQKSTPSAFADTVEKKIQNITTPQIIGKTTITPTSSLAAAINLERNSKPTKVEEGKAHFAKRRPQTPVSNGATLPKKRKNKELDRLMWDEGAVNMLNSLENERSKLEAEEHGDKPHRPLMRSRAATISERTAAIKRGTTPTSPKKELTSPNTTEAPCSIPPAAKKRGSKPKASATWDYVYKQQAREDAMIIRRRSNSSYSSTASLHRLSLDGPPPPKSAKSNSSSAATPASTSSTSTNKVEGKGSLKAAKAPPSSSAGVKATNVNKAFEFAKPENKQKSARRIKSPIQSTDGSSLTNDLKKTSGAGRRANRSPANVEEKEKSTKIAGKGEAKEDAVSLSPPSAFMEVTLKRVAKVAQIILNTQKAKINFTFSVQTMNKIVDILDMLATDDDCNVVVMITNSPNFCQGIDFTELVTGTAEKRRNAATQLATAVKSYLKMLATFPKPLIAGINGQNVGLGVMQLPLFDIVIASDKASYETPYAKIGQVPEGLCIWNCSTKIRDAFKIKLLWLCEKIHSTESALSGLINKLNASNKVNEEVLSTAKKIAAMSAETYRALKKTTIENRLKAIETALDEEFVTIVKQWTSTECQENFKKYLEIGHW